MKTKESAGLAIIYDNRLLMGHPTNARWFKSYSIPKGGIDEGETKLEAAIRETKEEVGLNIPLSLIDKTEHSFSLSTKKYNYDKTVYYYVVEIDDLSQLKLKDTKIPKNQLRLKEMDWAGFLTLEEALKRATPSQLALVNKLTTLGLLESRILNFKQFKNL